MQKKGTLYEYVAVYVDDPAIAIKDPKELTDLLEQKHKFKLKELVQFTIIWAWISVEIRITLCAFLLPNTLISSSRNMKNCLV
jgi:hypothetical protein